MKRCRGTEDRVKTTAAGALPAPRQPGNSLGGDANPRPVASTAPPVQEGSGTPMNHTACAPAGQAGPPPVRAGRADENVLPWALVPHALLSDRRLSPWE